MEVAIWVFRQVFKSVVSFLGMMSSLKAKEGENGGEEVSDVQLRQSLVSGTNLPLGVIIMMEGGLWGYCSGNFSFP